MRVGVRHIIFFLLTILVLNACSFFSSDNELWPFDLKPEALCTNSTAGEWTSLGLREETVLSILVHPKNPQVIFAGTGFDFSAQRDGKIFRSIDCGKSWEKVYEGGSFRGLLLHPEDPYTLFAWHHRPTGGLLRSTDGGESWELYTNGMHTNGNNLTSVVLIHPNNPRIMYASTSAFGSGNLYKSINGGGKWENITMNHWPHLASGATAMFMHPHQPDLMLHSANMNETLSRTEDGGKTWEDVIVSPGLVSAYAMNPQNPDQLVALASSLDPHGWTMISNDRGKNWQVEAVPDSILRLRDLKFVQEKLYIASEKGVLMPIDGQYKLFNEGLEVSKNRRSGHFLYVIKTDKYQNNMYIGQNFLTKEDFGGIFVRKIQ